jgi:hypothetical protein
LILAALYRLLVWKSDGGNQCYILANDEEQAGDDLQIAKKLVEVNPLLGESLVVKQKIIERYAEDDLKREREPVGFLEILPAGDVIGTHGKTYLFPASMRSMVIKTGISLKPWRWIRRARRR